MSINRLGKQCCVLDAISLVRLCQLELGVRRAIEWILDDFSVHIPSTIYEESCRNLSNDEDERKVFFDKVIACVDYEADASYDHLFRRQVDRLPAEQQSRIHEGETKAGAFALQLSHRHTQYLIFVTDDYKAIDSLRHLLREDQIGSVKNSYDLLLFLRSRHSNMLSAGATEVALKDLTQLLRNNSSTAPAFQKPDEMIIPYLEKIREGRLSVIPHDTA